MICRRSLVVCFLFRDFSRDLGIFFEIWDFFYAFFFFFGGGLFRIFPQSVKNIFTYLLYEFNLILTHLRVVLYLTMAFLTKITRLLMVEEANFRKIVRNTPYFRSIVSEGMFDFESSYQEYSNGM